MATDIARLALTHAPPPDHHSEGLSLGATLDPARARPGWVLVTGGSQTRSARTACMKGLPMRSPNGG